MEPFYERLHYSILYFGSNKKVNVLLKCEIVAREYFSCLTLHFSGKVMKQLFLEREALTFQWKEAIKMMQQRDNDVTNMQEQIVTTLEAIQKKEEKLLEENNFLNNEQRNNRDLELELQKVNAINSRTRNDLNELTQHMLFLNSEVNETLKFILNILN